MGLFDGLLGGGGGSADDPYADILTPAQRNQMQVQGLLAMAGAFAQAGMPSRLPVPFGSALGSAAAALGTGQEAGMKTAIENALAAQKVRDLRNMAEYRKKVLGDIDPTSPLGRAINAINNPGGTTPTPGPTPAGVAPPAGPYAGSPAGAGAAAGGGGGPIASLASGGLLGPSPDAGAAGEYGAGQTAGADVGAAGEYGGGQAISPVGRQANQTGTDYLGTLASAAAPYALPPGYSVAMTSGERPGATVAGTGGRSQHADANAGDFVIKDDKGQAIPNKGEDTSGHYGRLAQTMRQLADPALRQQLAWGGNFTTGGDNAPRDLMHFDLGGDRGRYGTLAAAAQAAGLLGPQETTQAPGGGLLAPASQVAAAAPLTGSAWEAANNNLGGLRRPGVPAAGPSQGGFQSFGTPQEGVTAISRQLDRYASGATTGTPLTTLRQIVSTWAPPNENDTQALIQRASQVVGVHPDQPLDVSNPAVKAKLIEATIRNEQGGRLPVDPQLIQQAAALQPPDQVIPSGPGAGGNPPAATLAQYTPGGGGAPGGAVPGMPQLAPPTQLAPSGVPGLPGAPAQGPGLPQTPANQQAALNTLIVELARRNAAAEVLGLGNPYGSLLTVLQGSPQYKALVESATTAARIAQEEPSKMRTDAAKARLDLIQQMAKDGLTLDENNNPVEVKGMREMLGRTAGEMERAKQQATSQFTLTDARVIGPDGQPTTTKMPVYEYIFRQQQAARNASMGAKPQPGDIVSSPISGPPPEGFEYRMDPNGKMTAQPIPGTPAEQVVKDRERKQAVSDQANLVARDIMVQNTNRIEDLVANSTLPVTGTTGPFLSRIGGTAANDVRVMIETMKARSSLDQLNQMRNSNPQGAGLGNVSNAEGDRLAAAIANLDQSQTKEQFLFNLRRTKELYIDAVHGPGTYSKLSDEPVLKVPSIPGGYQPIDQATYNSLPSGSPFTAPDGSRRIKP